jgi:hypothetical protein
LKNSLVPGRRCSFPVSDLESGCDFFFDLPDSIQNHVSYEGGSLG